MLLKRAAAIEIIDFIAASKAAFELSRCLHIFGCGKHNVDNVVQSGVLEWL
jgi:hypothetical protein